MACIIGMKTYKMMGASINPPSADACGNPYNMISGFRMTTTSQLGFFGTANRYAGLNAKNDPLVKIDAVVLWVSFHPQKNR